jgi:glucokinase
MPHGTIIGCDIGGSKCAIARYNLEDWREEAYEQVVTEKAQGFPHVFAQITSLIANMRTPDTVAVGLGVPGLVRSDDGRVLVMPNIPGSENVPLRADLEKALGLPVALDNDARCFTLAEALRGAGRGKPVVVGITLGTGVGGGIAIDGKIFGGAHGFAGEAGHMLLFPGQPPYPTTNMRGEAEQFLSGTALGKRCEAAKRPEEYLEGEVCKFLQPSLFRELAWFLVSVTHLVDPSVVVLGGSTGKALKPHLPAVVRELGAWMLPNMPLPELTVSELPHAACLGAALLADATRLSA